jgi:two-component system, OmpR family, alkaline phosphatase synthesis response regulator PhoP
MTRTHILVVDDEADILELVQYHLVQWGYDVTCACSGEEALTQVAAGCPDLVVLDLMLPGIDGLGVCQAIKRNKQTTHIPVIMLTVRDEEVDVVTALELGADDYLTKPFSPRVLMARIKAVLRRHQEPPEHEDTALNYGPMVISPVRHTVLLHGRPVPLTATEFRILCLLAGRPGWVFSRQQILETTSGYEVSATERSVDVHIASLRRKLGYYGDTIKTIRGVRYRFSEALEHEQPV